MAAHVVGAGDEAEEVGVRGEAIAAEGVLGISHAAFRAGVRGVNDNATKEAGVGVHGQSAATGVLGESSTWHGVVGFSTSTTGGHGVHGEGAVGASGVGRTWIGVYGETHASAEVGAAGIWGDGKAAGDGVKGVATGAGKAAVCGFHLGGNGPGVFGRGNPAGHFDGRVVIDGTLEVSGDVLLQGADYAEALTTDVAGVEPGTVMSVEADGVVRPCRQEYDPTVAGIVSGAGDVRPAVVLDPHDGGVPIALMGKVWCQVEADSEPVVPGDLLTTSAVPGHARRASDLGRAHGAIVGKALTGLAEGRGLVRVLVGMR